VLYEQYLLHSDKDALRNLKSLIRENIHTYIEYALDYFWAGQYEEALAMLDLGISCQENVYPMAHYYKGWIYANFSNQQASMCEFEIAEQCSPDFCFPNRLESVLALQNAIESNPKGDKACYYLGNFWYAASQVDDAVQCWEMSKKLNPSFPIVLRNLALAYYNKLDRKAEALDLLEMAFALDSTDSRILMELDQLHKKLNYAPVKRLGFLDSHKEQVEKRDDTYLEVVALYNLSGEFKNALEMLLSRKFHPWEGGEGKVTSQYIFSLIELAKEAILTTEYNMAIEYLDRSKEYPHNLGEGKLYGAQENDTNYWLGCAYEGLGESKKAIEYWELASKGLSEPVAAWFYNDQQPDQIFYQGLALLKLGRKSEARDRFTSLVDYGEKQLSVEVKTNYFAVSLPDLLIWEESLTVRNEIHCRYLIGLGNLGLGNQTVAKNELQKVITLDIHHMGALVALKLFY
jgi:tetratricopeptide (TPR) repeat protein